MGQGPESRADVEESPIPVEFLNGRFRHVCSMWSGVVVMKNHSMSSNHPGIFAGLLPSEGEVIDN
jgi:hypothetical protein